MRGEIIASGVGVWHHDYGIGNERYSIYPGVVSGHDAGVDVTDHAATPVGVVDDGSWTPDQMAARQLGSYPSAFDVVAHQDPYVDSARREQAAIRAAAAAAGKL